MFTGIVQAVGRIVDVQALGAGPDAGVRLTVATPASQPKDFLDGIKLGDSIAIQGACMTVVAFSAHAFKVDVSRESLARTVGLDTAGEVNLEHALRLGDTLDGHLVSGHVDGTGQVARFAPVGESILLQIDVPAPLAHYMAYKGSVAVNGVSLTVNAVADKEDGNDRGCCISINLIAHTVQHTTLRTLSAGARVNLEVDTIARYVDRMLGRSKGQGRAIG